MNITMKLLFASVLILAAIGLSKSAEAAEPANRFVLASVEEPEASQFTQNLHVDEEWQRWDGATIGWQILGGVAGGTAGFFVGIPLGVAVANGTTNCASREWGCFNGAIIGALTGTVVGSWLGVHSAGHLSGGDGNIGGSLLGTVLGGAAGVLIIGLTASSDFGISVGLPTAAALTVGGGIAGYHLTASATVTGVGIAPTEGGATFGLTGHF